jgi:hypothetical protein
MYQAERGDPGYAQQDLERYRRASPAEMLSSAKKVLLPGAVVVLSTVPRKKGAAK